MLNPRKFLANRSGAFAMQFALMAAPLCVCTGLAIDGGRSFLARYELASALDAAALAVGSSTESDPEKLEALARVFVERNFRTPHVDQINLNLVATRDNVTLRGDVTINTYFMPLVGRPYVTVGAESEVRRGGNNVEVALALDITGSMSGTRIVALKAAAKDLIDEVVQPIQTPFFSKVAIAPWANNVYVGDVAESIRGSTTGPRNVTAATWRDGSTKSLSAATWKDGAAKTITGVSKASQAVVTSNGHGLSNGDYIYISGVNGMTQLNNKRYLVSNVATNTFRLKNADTGSYINSSSYGTYKTPNATAQKCFTQTCEVRVSASSHGFSNGDYVYVTGVNGMTQINNAAGSTWEVKNAASGTFILGGSDGPSTSNYSSGGSAQKCFTSSCEVRVTAASHGLSNDEYVRISGVNGMTQINTSGHNSHQVTGVTSNTFILQGTVGPSVSNYSSGGTSQCLTHGCNLMRYINNSGAARVLAVSSCVTERLGPQAYTDAAPASAPAGLDYPAGSYGMCDAGNMITPLSDNATTLKQKIDAMELTGSTAGQIGVAWAWYLLSPNWGSIWPENISRPQPYGTEDLVKVAVIMTDGEFNTAHCQGVQSKNYAINGNADKINCNATNGAPFTQAQALCTAMRGQNIIIYTVGFELAPNGSAATFMANCATSPQHAYLASGSEELSEAFRQIATSITKLRIAR